MCGKVLKVLICLATVIYLVSADCRLNVEGEAIILKNFGFKKVIVTDKNVYLRQGEFLDVYCETGLMKCDVSIGPTVAIKCHSNYLFYSKPGSDNFDHLNCNLRCELKSKIQLYESGRKLPNCESYTSLAIGIHVANVTSKTFAGICYDWNNLDLKYVNYMAYRSRNNIFTDVTTQNNFEFDAVTMDQPVLDYGKYFNFLSEREFDAYYAILQNNISLLTNFQFDYSSLIQDRPLTSDFELFTDILNVIWWRNLRRGNWRYFLNLLEERSKWVKYNITTGISGVSVIPTYGNTCQSNETMTVVNQNNVRRSAPAYIWSHLTSLNSNVTEDFVVIGYNSPFYSNDSSIIFCQDICADIDWLKKFGKVRLMPTMGLIFCCRPADVAHKLDNFPWNADKITAETEMDGFESISTTTTTPYYLTSSNEITQISNEQFN